MKKITLFSLLLLAAIVSGCNFPGYEGFGPEESDDLMATEIAEILTGTPGEIVTLPTSEGDDLEPTNTPVSEDTETVVNDTATPEATTASPESPTSTPETATATPTLTATPTFTPTATLSDTDPTLTLGEPDWVDGMEDGDNWAKGATEFASVKFEDGYMKITSKTAQSGWYLTWPSLENFYLEAKVQSPNAEGSDHFGIMFRVPDTHKNNKGYLFGINAKGDYSLNLWNKPSMQSLIYWTANEVINTGEKLQNTLGVMAKDGTLTLYINGVKVDEISDSTFAQGGFGIFMGGVDASVWVDQIRYWENP
jgi:hypothetical protein